MELLNEYELKQVVGGGISFGLGTAIVAGIAFLVSVIDGYVRPLTCRS